jgi:hypothetical protein
MFRTKVVEKIKMHILLGSFLLPKIVPIMRQCGKNIVERDRPQMTMWHMRIAFLIPKATNTHSEYVTLIAFPLQQCLTNAPQCYVVRTLLPLVDCIYTS